MATLITDAELKERLKEQRRASGGDRYDEVWDGVYLMSPLANVEHQALVGDIFSVFRAVVLAHGLGSVYPGLSVSDRDDDWEQNYRRPDVVVLLKGCPAKLCKNHLFGGPDLVAEVVSPNDRSRAKLGFYAEIGVRELFLVDREPWALELCKLDAGQLRLAGQSAVDSPGELQSDVLPLNFRLVPGQKRPSIEIAERVGGQAWQI